MTYNWKEIATQVGSIIPKREGCPLYGKDKDNSYAQKAIEIILGEDEIKEMVECYLNYDENYMVIESVFFIK